MTNLDSLHNYKHYHTKIPNPKTSLLHPGQELTYKELITLLDEDFIEPTNSSRKKQLRDFEKLFSYSKGPGRKFTINEVYPISSIEERLEQEEMQKNEGVSPLLLQKARTKSDASTYFLPELIANPRKYTSLHRGKYYLPFVNILLRYLSQAYGNSMAFIPARFFYEMGMINTKYQITPHNQPYKFADGIYTASAHEVRWFYQTTYSRIKDIVKTQLNALETLGAIYYTSGYILFYHDEGYFKANDREEKMIREAETYTLDLFQMDSVSDVILHNKTKAFYTKVKEGLPKEFEAQKFYNSYNIVISDWISENITPMDEEEHLKWQKEMNDLVVNSLKETVVHFYNNYNSKTTQAVAQGEEDPHYYSRYFIETEQKLVDELLRID